MSRDSSPLGEQFRGILEQRAERLMNLLEVGCNSRRNEMPRRELLGELHTLKGEAKMLGWSPLATLVHVLEDRLGLEEPDQEEAAAVVDAIVLSLVKGTSRTDAENLWRTSYEALTGSPLTISDAGTQEPRDILQEPGKSSEGTPRPESWIRVEAHKVEKLGEALALLLVDFSRFSLRACERNGTSGRVGQQELESEGERLRAALSDVLELSLDLRLTPVEPMFARLAAHARALALQRGKPVTVVTESEGARVERGVIERLAEPLMHLVSNAVDHGIEGPEARDDATSASLELRAKMQGARVLLEIRDNGRGIDREAVHRKAVGEGRLPPDSTSADALNVLFQPGFSMKESTDEVSGRGIGLDVVKRTADSMGVTLSLSSELGHGTTFTLGVPSALARQDLFVMQVGKTLCGLPGRLVLFVAHDSDLDDEARTFRYEDEILPLRSLAQALDLSTEKSERFVVVTQLGERRVAIRCEHIVGHQALVRREVAGALNRSKGINASALTERAELVLILDSDRLLERLLQNNAVKSHANLPTAPDRRRILIVDDSVIVRNLLQGMFVSAGYEVTLAEDGVRALEQLDVFEPGLVLSDIEMPVMGGFELLRRIRERDDLVPIVLVTARSSAEDRSKAANLGASAYVTKGEFESESLLSVVERLYRGH